MRHVYIYSALARGSLRHQHAQSGELQLLLVPPSAGAGGALRPHQTALLPALVVRHSVEQGKLTNYERISSLDSLSFA